MPITVEMHIRTPVHHEQSEACTECVRDENLIIIGEENDGAMTRTTDANFTEKKPIDCIGPPQSECRTFKYIWILDHLESSNLINK